MQKLSRSDRPADLPMAPMFVSLPVVAERGSSRLIPVASCPLLTGLGPTSLKRRLGTCEFFPTLFPRPFLGADQCVFPVHSMLKDAFNPEEETERDWDLELRDDVKGEAEGKYGKVADIFVVKESQVRPFPSHPSTKGAKTTTNLAQGEIYIRFETVESAISAVAGLNGRWFGGRQISAAHCSDSLFDAKK